MKKTLPTVSEILDAIKKPQGSATYNGETEVQFTFNGEPMRVRYTGVDALAAGTYRLFANSVRAQIDLTFDQGKALKCKASGEGDKDLDLAELKLKRANGKDGADSKAFEAEAAEVRVKVK